MGKFRFVTPQVDRLELSDGDWVEVKHELTAGEQAKMSGSAMRMMRPENKDTGEAAAFEIDSTRLAFARLEAYLTDWSFRDSTDKPVSITRDTLSALSGDTLTELNAVLDAHLESGRQEKKATTGSPALRAV